MTGIVVCHVVLRDRAVDCVVRLATDGECVLVLFLALALNLGSCARHCHHSACAASRAGQEPFPRAQDLTWRCDLCVALRNRKEDWSELCICTGLVELKGNLVCDKMARPSKAATTEQIPS